MLFWHLLGRENAHIRSSMLRFSLGRSFKIAIVIQFFCFLEVCSFGIWLVVKILTYARYAAVLPPSTSLKIAIVIQFFSFFRGMLFWYLLGHENAHIRQVNCGFSVCESLKIPLFIRFQRS